MVKILCNKGIVIAHSQNVGNKGVVYAYKIFITKLFMIRNIYKVVVNPNKIFITKLLHLLQKIFTTKLFCMLQNICNSVIIYKHKIFTTNLC